MMKKKKKIFLDKLIDCVNTNHFWKGTENASATILGISIRQKEKEKTWNTE